MAQPLAKFEDYCAGVKGAARNNREYSEDREKPHSPLQCHCIIYLA